MILQSPTAPRASSNLSKSKRDPQKGFYEVETTMRIKASRILQGYPGQRGILSPEVSKNSSVTIQSCAKCQERDWLTQHSISALCSHLEALFLQLNPRRLLHPFSKLIALTATQGHCNQQFKKNGRSSQEFHVKKRTITSTREFR